MCRKKATTSQLIFSLELNFICSHQCKQLCEQLETTVTVSFNITLFNFLLHKCILGWFRAILPKSALRVEEEAWNAYPYTKTIYRCPFIEKFTLEIETKYQSDGGEQDNIFNMSSAELRTRTVGRSSFVTSLKKSW